MSIITIPRKYERAVIAEMAKLGIEYADDDGDWLCDGYIDGLSEAECAAEIAAHRSDT